MTGGDTMLRRGLLRVRFGGTNSGRGIIPTKPKLLFLCDVCASAANPAIPLQAAAKPIRRWLAVVIQLQHLCHIKSVREVSMEAVTINHQLLAKAGSPLSFASGEVIFRAGDPGDNMYVVRSGEVEIELNGKVIETVASGGFFGEMALIDGSPRVATCRAKTNCEVAAINEKNFVILVDEMPYFALFVMRTLVSRLRLMDQRL